MKHYGLSELKAARKQGSALLFATFLFSIFVNFLMLTGPLFMLQVYDRVLGSRSEETLAALFILICALFFLMGVLDYARGRVLARFGARFQSHLEPRVFGAVMRRALLPKERSAPNSGLRDLEAIQSVFTSPAMLALFDVPWTPLFIGAIFIFHPLLGWLSVAGGAALIVVTLLNNWLTASKVARAQGTSHLAHRFSEDMRQGAEILRAQGMTPAAQNRWQQMRTGALEQTLGASDWTGLFTAGTKAFRMFLQSLMLAAGAYLVLQGELTAGAMIAGSILLGRALAPIEQSIGQWPQVQKARKAWRDLSQLLEATPPESETMRLPKPEAHLTLQGVTAYVAGGKAPTLSGVSFALHPGEALGVIGKSGAGKSTLAKVVLGLLPPAMGEVRLGGATLDQYGAEALGASVGYLPQQVTLFNGTIAENIARLSQSPDEAQVVEAAKRANAHEMILSLPDGYNTQIFGAESQLSGGQRQRIGLARALYGDPVLLVLDEPNSALDAEGSDALNQAIRAFKDTDKAVILMTHRPQAIAECDRLIVLDQGKIKATGPRDEVLRSMVKNADHLIRKGA